MGGHTMINRWFDILSGLFPQKIKYRLFFSFVLVILIPFFLLQIYYYRQTEDLLVQKICVQDKAQLTIMKEDLDEIFSLAFRQLIRLEKEDVITEGLRRTNSEDWKERGQSIRELLDQLSKQFPAQSLYLDYTVMDLDGRMVHAGSDKPINEDTDWGLQAIGNLKAGSKSYSWTLSEFDPLAEGTVNNRMMTLTGLLQDQGEVIGVGRIRFDLSAWLRSTSRSFPVKSNYYLVEGTGQILVQTEVFSGIQSSMMAKLIGNDMNTVNEDYSILYNGLSLGLPSPKLMLLSAFPLHIYFGDFKMLEHKFMLTFMILTTLFILLTFLISSMITRPLQLLKRKMETTVHSSLKTLLPEKPYYGELLILAKTFNRMVRDMNQLIQQLKVEERQKEAVKFQMLLAQMNPHFLLNTLNTLKWSAIGRDDQITADICIHLGKLLETSLNAEVDLIYLNSEIELVESYMQIQNFRYEQRFSIRYEYEERLQYVLIPKLSLQPLVENAIVHGFARMNHGDILVRAYESDQRLIVEVIDNGHGIEEAERNKSRRARKGIGLSNVRERLQLLFKQEGDLQLIFMEQGTVARMCLPILVAEPYNSGGNLDVEAAHS
ncbi:Sensor histidine kinase YehU [compost metagenome]